MNVFVPPAHSPEMMNALQRAQQTSAILVQATPPIPDGERSILLGLYSSQMFEHLQAILMLCDSKQCPGSAIALFRPLIETSLRGIWLYSCASAERFADFLENESFRFPGFKELAHAVDTKNMFKGHYDDIVKSYSNMCDFTHSGFQQVTSRLSPTGIGPAYDDRMLVGVLREAEKATLFHFWFLCQAVGHLEGTNLLGQRASALKKDQGLTKNQSERVDLK